MLFGKRTPFAVCLRFFGKSEFAAFYNMRARKNAAKRENPAVRLTPTAGCLLTHGKSQATARRDFRESTHFSYTLLFSTPMYGRLR